MLLFFIKLNKQNKTEKQLFHWREMNKLQLDAEADISTGTLYECSFPQQLKLREEKQNNEQSETCVEKKLLWTASKYSRLHLWNNENYTIDLATLKSI